MKNVLTILKPRLAHHLAHHQVGTRRCVFGLGFQIFAFSSWHLGPDTIFLLCAIFWVFTLHIVVAIKNIKNVLT